MKHLLILLAFAGCLSVNAQSVTESANQQTSLTDAEFQKSKDAYLNMMQTDTYKANRKAMSAIIDKMNNNVDANIIDKDKWKDWISKNLMKTKFKSVEEAVELRQLNADLTQKQMEENSELYDLMKRASVEQRAKLMKLERAQLQF